MSVTVLCRDERVEVANKVLKSFAPETTIVLDAHGYVVVCWKDHCGKLIERRWMTRGQSFYPTWSKLWCHGGTATVALAQLVRWIKGRPVLPLTTWMYWACDRVALLRQQNDNGAAAIESLRDAGYPEVSKCVLCGVDLAIAGFDWWCLDGVSGPCCHHTQGCRQDTTRKTRQT